MAPEKKFWPYWASVRGFIHLGEQRPKGAQLNSMRAALVLVRFCSFRPRGRGHKQYPCGGLEVVFDIDCLPAHDETLLAPELTSYLGEGAGECWPLFAVPGADRNLDPGSAVEASPQQDDDGERPEQAGVVRAIVWSNHWWDRAARPSRLAPLACHCGARRPC